jgi:hypothetical protein
MEWLIEILFFSLELTCYFICYLLFVIWHDGEIQDCQSC